MISSQIGQTWHWLTLSLSFFVLVLLTEETTLGVKAPARFPRLPDIYGHDIYGHVIIIASGMLSMHRRWI